MSGDLDVTDEDSGENQVQPIAAGTAGTNGYGTFEVPADGAWTYTLDNADPAVQALPAGQTLQDTIMVTSQDGTDTQLITITITGTNGVASHHRRQQRCCRPRTASRRCRAISM